MEIIFLGGFFPKQFSNEILSHSKLQVQNSANTFQWAFINGVIKNFDKPITLITAPFIGWYPKYYRKISISTNQFSFENNYNGVLVGFCNLPLIKNIVKYFNLSLQLKRFVKREEDTVIIVYSLESAYLNAALNAKRKNPRLKVCVIIADLHEFPGDSSFLYESYIKYVEKPLFYSALSKIDCFVVLTEKMVDFLKIREKNWIRIEGLYQKPQFEVEKMESDSQTKIILYTGTLDYKYGIKNLLDAFNMISAKNYQLWICGGGPGMNLIKERMHADDRIKYFGIVPGEKVAELQGKATILINPREPSGEFNKYSFPSKTMEYFASGTPTLLYKLDGIPDEYFQYCYTIGGTATGDLSAAITQVCELDSETLLAKGKAAKDFILKYKTAEVQCEKVLQMLKKME